MSLALVHKQIEAGFRRALKNAGTSVTWERSAPDADLPVGVIINPVDESSDQVDRNSGDDRKSVLSALVADFAPAGALPEQGDSFIDDEGTAYRVTRVEHPPRHPIIHFTCGHPASA